MLESTLNLSSLKRNGIDAAAEILIVEIDHPAVSVRRLHNDAAIRLLHRAQIVFRENMALKINHHRRQALWLVGITHFRLPFALRTTPVLALGKRSLGRNLDGRRTEFSQRQLLRITNVFFRKAIRPLQPVPTVSIKD